MNSKSNNIKFIALVKGKRTEPEGAVSETTRAMFLQVDDNSLYVVLDDHLSILGLLFMIMFSDVFMLVIAGGSIASGTFTSDGFWIAFVAIDIFWVIIWIMKTRDVHAYFFATNDRSVIKYSIHANQARDAMEREIVVADTREISGKKPIPFIIDKIVCFEGNGATTVDSLYFLDVKGNKMYFCKGYLKAKILQCAHFLSAILGIPIQYEVIGHGFTPGWRKYEHGSFVGYLTT